MCLNLRMSDLGTGGPRVGRVRWRGGGGGGREGGWVGWGWGGGGGAIKAWGVCGAVPEPSLQPLLF